MLERIIMDKIKTVLIVAVSIVMDFLGILAIPVFLMVGCNIIDYITGLMASKYREEQISSYKGMRGIIKKVSMWILVVVGAVVDELIQYASQTIGLNIQLPFIVASLVAVWIIVNEVISILENIIDIDEKIIPPFLMPIVRRIKKEIEAVTDENANTK